MALVMTVLQALTVAFMIAFIYGQNNNTVSSECLACICEASTNCNASTTCFTPEQSGGFYCGAFHISREYWLDADRPVIKGDKPGSKDSFNNCMLDLVCSAQTVERYMKKFTSGRRRLNGDCNGNGKIDCDDFFRIHRLGAFNCENPSILNSTAYKKFTTCWDVVQAASLAKSIS
ncbi:hypothetical protein OTU49_015717 [Cherax quadricarinatus]|uniref:lysozyme n=1 Tax=Cherax quadricarinatus TaxID=27406 RepID=A0AAW0YB21_CHEQU|nr:lysozyme-like [Cherax quadricarinatus]